MKKITNWIFTVALFFTANVLFAQSKITGTVIDSGLNTPLAGVNVKVKGATGGVATDAEGKFTLATPASSGQLVISLIGYDSKTIDFNGKEVGTIKLSPATNQLEEVIVKSGVVDIAKDRQTPVAVSTIKAAEIQQKLGNREFVEILKTTPSIYASTGSGGYGDSRITVRGFGQENIAVMVNGVPVNDMENGAVYWSNWSGLSQVASAVQVQRGLGSSRLAISSVGGTINVVTKSSQRAKGGLLSSITGNNGYRSFSGSYSTGKMKDGFSASVLLSYTDGDGYVNGTNFKSSNYFIALGQEINKKHNLEFTFTGAPQWHNQRSTSMTIDRYLKMSDNGNPNRSWNDDFGYRNGEEFNIVRNYYHKPVASLNWEYKINKTLSLNTIAYGSWGRGGGSTGRGKIGGKSYNANELRTANGFVDYDRIVSYNTGNPIFLNGSTTSLTKAPVAGYGNVVSESDGISMVSGINSHNWYGAISSLNYKKNNLSIDGGIDYRFYKGIHTRNINDLMGADFYKNTNDVNNTLFYTNDTTPATPSFNPFYNATKTTAVNRNYNVYANWLGLFTQAEYITNKYTAYLQGAISNQTYQREDLFNYKSTDTNPAQKSDVQKRMGGNIKAGFNYNLNKLHNVFINGGYYSRQPYLSFVFPGYRNIVDENVKNEKIVGVEIGYGFRSSKFNANLNLYRTDWKDRNFSKNDPNSTGNPGGYILCNNVHQLHTGIEADFTYKPFKTLTINGMGSIGDWKYVGDITASIYNNQSVLVSNSLPLYVDGAKVGNSAQTTASLGLTYEFLPRLKFAATYFYNEKLYGDSTSDITTFSTTTAKDKGALKLPSYNLFDAGLYYSINLGKDNKDSLLFNFNMNNVFNTYYILESSTNIFASDVPTVSTYKGIANTNKVWFGNGRTWNFGITYKF